jgi:hypothetical protein
VLSPFPCLSPGMDTQCFLCDFCSSSPWPPSWQLQLRCLSRFRSCERMFRSRSCQLICRFITNNTLMTYYPYRLNSVMFYQLRELVTVTGLMKIPSIYTRNSGTMKLDTEGKESDILWHISRRRAAEYNVTTSQDQWRVRESPCGKFTEHMHKIT